MLLASANNRDVAVEIVVLGRTVIGNPYVAIHPRVTGEEVGGNGVVLRTEKFLELAWRQ